MGKQRILIIGVSTRALAESAKEAGYDCLALDYFGDYDQKSWCENYSLKRDYNLTYGARNLYQVSRKLHYHAVVYTASLENHPHIVSKLAAGASQQQGATGPVLLGNRPEVLARVRHSSTFFGFLARLGVPTPKTLDAGRTADLTNWPADQGAVAAPEVWLRKPIRSGGGQHVSYWPGNRPVGKGFVLQQFLPGRPCSVAFIANGRDAVVLGVSEQLIGRPEFGGRNFIYCGNIYPLPECQSAAGARVVDDLTAIVTALTREFGLVGLNGLDFILLEDQVWPIEINPRYTASMELIELATGLSVFDWHVRSIREGKLPPIDADERRGNPTYYGKTILYAERPCRAPDTTGWAERGIRDIPFPGEEITRGSPICTLLATGTTASACHASLVDKAEQLKGELYA